ncbi:hypothetical protein [Chamaesiphon sp.]|uniref:hypothetical protein n=1 Tax=Chamaesiphon sp. TaxID=2814140 RepID=UPI0035940BD8
MWLFKNDRFTIYQLVDGKYQVSENSRYFPNLSLQQTIDLCVATAKTKGTGIAISELRRSVSNIAIY